ncbi:glycosyl transferase, partial [Aliarcobacter butzleri]
PKLRLIIQAIEAIGGLYFLGGFGTLTFGVFDIQNPIITKIFAFFMIIWFINLYNFLIVINGYVGREGLFLVVGGF